MGDAAWRDPVLLAKDQAKRAMDLLLAHPLAGPLVDRTPPNALDVSLQRLEDEESKEADYWDDIATELAAWEIDLLTSPHENDPINHPAHYAQGWSNGAEVIDITENLNFNRGNAVKYLARAGRKDSMTELQDLRKAAWYVDRELERLSQ